MFAACNTVLGVCGKRLVTEWSYTYHNLSGLYSEESLKERFSYDVEKWLSVRYMFYQPMDEKIKTWPLRFPAKENPNMEKALFDWPIVLQCDKVSIDLLIVVVIVVRLLLLVNSSLVASCQLLIFI